MQTGQRQLCVVADDFGMGPGTSHGILQLARRGIVTGSVALINSPYAEEAIDAWRADGAALELGWHPNLTLDAPILPAAAVPSLVGHDGRFLGLGGFLKRWLLGRLRPAEIEAELRAQLERFRDLVGALPSVINAHQHATLFQPVGDILLRILMEAGYRPYLRRVQEPWQLVAQIPGARKKRVLLNLLGRRLGHVQRVLGFPGNDWLVGITDAPAVRDPEFFTRWLRHAPGSRIELICHPGYPDPTVVGRNPEEDADMMQRRVNEQALLDSGSFLAAVRAEGFTLVPPSQLAGGRAHGRAA